MTFRFPTAAVPVGWRPLRLAVALLAGALAALPSAATQSSRPT